MLFRVFVLFFLVLFGQNSYAMDSEADMFWNWLQGSGRSNIKNFSSDGCSKLPDSYKNTAGGIVA